MFKSHYFSMAAITIMGLSSVANAGAESNYYKQLTGTSIYSANNRYLQSGWYDMDGGDTGNNPEMTNSNFVGSYIFGQNNDTLRPFVMGGFGFTKIQQDRSTVGNSVGNIDLDSTYYQLGGGIDYNPTSNISLAVGATGLWMSTDGDYNGASDSMQYYFNQESDTSIYDLFAVIGYHTEINGYKPYAELMLHYLSIHYDFGLSDTDGWSTDLEAGVYTPTLTTWLDLPVRARFFAAATLLDNDLSTDVLFDNAYSGGARLLWKVGPLIPIFNNAFKETELGFTLQGTMGDNDLSGWKASLGFYIAKF
ncbi:hypothetical protein YH65_02745 [Sulfurovum lithotrophicum]|uniref:Autotransporter domain-containing protein n=1 Tax=Sulfurovum lithotrophicum TaxID=206403 RepID=A0A7U4RQ67_9BACT|nr:hypothetical protein [Sulfurovum lithotrophicum]AKF24431.1 hypothetical protein YH65_02745 [Sulfurovum lithotrophicum]